MNRRTWSKERVAQSILARQRQGLPLATIYQDDINLYAAGKRYFGTWNKALQAAGLPEHKKRWSRKAVVCAILARQRQGLPLLDADRHDPTLAMAARRYFGSVPRRSKRPACPHCAGTGRGSE